MKKSKKVVSYRIRETTIEKVRKQAKRQGISINDYVDGVLLAAAELAEMFKQEYAATKTKR